MTDIHTAPSSTYERVSSHFNLHLNEKIFTIALYEDIRYFIGIYNYACGKPKLAHLLGCTKNSYGQHLSHLIITSLLGYG
jgi:hypothetical protein